MITGLFSDRWSEIIEEIHILSLIEVNPGLSLIPPNSLLGMIVRKPGAGKQAASKSKFFPTPDGTCWKDIQIETVSRDSLIVRAGKVTKQYHGFDMSFRDRRKIDRLGNQWELLEKLAQNRGTIN